LDKVIAKLKEIITNNIDSKYEDIIVSVNICERDIHLSQCKKSDVNSITNKIFLSELENKVISRCCIKEVSDLYPSFTDKVISDSLAMLDSIDYLSNSLIIDKNFINGDIFININSDIDDLDLALSGITHNYLKLSNDIRFYKLYIDIIKKVEKYIIDKYKSQLSVEKIKKLTKQYHNFSEDLIKTSIYDQYLEDSEMDSLSDPDSPYVNESYNVNLDMEEAKIRETLIKLFVGRRVASRAIIYIPQWVYEVLKSIDSRLLGTPYKEYNREVDKAAEILFNESGRGDPCYNYDTAFKTAALLDK
jgi:hypothetical protein